MPGQQQPQQGQAGPQAAAPATAAPATAGPAQGAAAGDQSNSAQPGAGQGAGQAAAAPPAAPNTKKQAAAAANLGSLKSMDGGFSSKAGAVLDTLVPDIGVSGKLQLNVNIPVMTGVDVGFEFICAAERDDKNKIKLRIQLGGTVTAQASAWLIEAWAQAKIYGYMEAYGDNGAECFRLLQLGLYERIKGASERLANAVFDGKYIADTVKDMDDDDYIETGVGASLSAGVGVKDPTSSEGGKLGAGAIGVEGSMGTKISKGKDGKIKKEDVSQWSVGVSVEKDPFSFEGKFTAKAKGQKFEGAEIELSASKSLAITDLDKMITEQFVSGLVQNLASTVKGTKGMFQKNPTTGQQVGSFANFLMAQSGGRLGVEAGTHAALSRVSGFAGVKVGHKVTVKGTMSAEGKPGLEVKLERTSAIQFGDSPRSKVFVLLENVQPVFFFKVGG
jgi:hypothetical protein